jgi:hypothetical protein
MSARSILRKGVASVVALLIILCALLGWAGVASAQTQTAVEYYYADWNNYFVTSFPNEIAVLDGGAFGGVWKRTGQTFDVWIDATNGRLPTCRFFSISFAPKSSHFYTPYAAECAGLMNNPDWEFEAIAFYLLLPDANGNCPAGTEVLYRLYNNAMGGAPNHRFTRSATQFNLMRAAGWIFEGNGLTGAFACVPTSAPPAPTPEGFWFGTMTTGANLYAFILDTSVYYLLYTATNANTLLGVVEGTLVSSNGNFTSSDALDFAIGRGPVAASVSGSFVARATINGLISEAAGGTGFSAGYEAAYELPVNIAGAAGAFSGEAGTSQGVVMMVMTLDASGTMSGSVGNCTFEGTATPHGGINVLNVVFIFDSGPCSYSGSTFKGIAFYNSNSNKFYGAAPNAARTENLLFLVIKPQGP